VSDATSEEKGSGTPERSEMIASHHLAVGHLAVVFEAEPADRERLSVVVVVGLDLGRAAYFTRLLEQVPGADGVCELAASLALARETIPENPLILQHLLFAFWVLATLTLICGASRPCLYVVLTHVFLGAGLALPK
jgi:hypothetical protein